MTATGLECPTCGHGGRTNAPLSRAFRYVADVTSLRWIVGVDTDGALRVDAEEHIANEEGGRAQRLQCSRCLAEFPLPRGMRVTFTC